MTFSDICSNVCCVETEKNTAKIRCFLCSLVFMVADIMCIRPRPLILLNSCFATGLYQKTVSTYKSIIPPSFMLSSKSELFCHFRGFNSWTKIEQFLTYLGFFACSRKTVLKKWNWTLKALFSFLPYLVP